MHTADRRRIFVFTLNSAVLVLSIVFFAWIARAGINARMTPPLRGVGHDPHIQRVNRQQDVFPIYKSAALRGARVVHLNRFFNMQVYSPKEQFITTDFPVEIKEFHAVFEPYIDSHNWLFIATRTGLVRTVTTVLPDNIFQERLRDPSDGIFSHSRGTIAGFTYDITRTIASLDTLPAIDEPVIVNVDAGFFSDGEDPSRTVAALKKQCRDVRMLVLIDSLDEPEVTDAMRNQLKSFETAWRK